MITVQTLVGFADAAEQFRVPASKLRLIAQLLLHSAITPFILTLLVVLPVGTNLKSCRIKRETCSRAQVGHRSTIVRDHVG